MATVVVATVTTAHFEFVAIGANVEEAKAALLSGWAKHRREYTGAERDYMRHAIDDGEAHFTPLTVGGCARDGEPL